MKKYFLISIILMLGIMLSAQTQQGYVKTKGRMVNGKHVPGQGLKGASVSIQNRTPVVVQNDNGSFSFPIPAKTFMLQSVQKNGYELVDADVLKKSYNYSTNPIYLVMETPEQQTQDQLDSERKIRRTLQRQLQEREDELEALKEANRITLDEYQQALQKLYADQQNNEKFIADMAKEYAQLDYDQMDDLNQRISDAIINGRLTEADSLLRSKGDMKSRVDKIKKEQQAEAQREAEIVQEQQDLDEAKAGTQKRLEDIASDCYKFFNLYKLNMEWDSAAYYIETLAELDTTNADWQYDAGHYYYKQNCFVQSQKFCSRALESRRCLAKENPQAYESNLAMTLNSCAILYYYIQRLTESETMYSEALEIYRRLAKDNPQAYEPDLAQALNNLANMYSDTQRLKESETMYLEALEIHRRLAKDNPQAYEPVLAKTMHNLANLYSNTQRLTESETLFLEALEIRRRLAKGTPQAYEPDLAMTLFYLANLYKNTERLTESETMYLESLKIYRCLAKNNPQSYEPHLAVTLNNLANLYSDTQRLTESETMYLEALEIRRRLAKANPQAYEPVLATTLYNYGLLMIDEEKYLEAISFFEEALAIYRRLVLDNSFYFKDYYDSSLYFLSQLYTTTNEHAKKHYEINEEWLPIFKVNYQNDPERFQEDYINALGSQSFQCIFAGQFEKSEKYAREALAIDSTQHWIFSNLAASLLFQGKYDEAKTVYRQYKDELKDGFLQDFNDFETAKVIPKERKADVERIRKMLTEE